MVREGEAHADPTCELGAVIARPEQIKRRQVDVGGHRHDIAERMVCRPGAGFPQHEFLQSLEEVVAFAPVLPAS